jgi:hypothetical protein
VLTTQNLNLCDMLQGVLQYKINPIPKEVDIEQLGNLSLNNFLQQILTEKDLLLLIKVTIAEKAATLKLKSQ